MSHDQQATHTFETTGERVALVAGTSAKGGTVQVEFIEGSKVHISIRSGYRRYPKAFPVDSPDNR